MTGEVAQSSLFEIAQGRARHGHPFALPELVEMFGPVVRLLGAGGAANPSYDRTLSPSAFRLTGSATKPRVELVEPSDEFVLEPVSGVGSDTGYSWAHAAPEQWLPEEYGAPGPWTDVWGVALTLVELCSGRPVATGDEPALMARLLDAARRPTPAALGVSVTAEVEAVFSRALALAPAERFADIGAFFAALARALGGTGPERFGEVVLMNSPFEIPDLDVSVPPPSRASAPSPASTPSHASASSRQPVSSRGSGKRSSVPPAHDWDSGLASATEQAEGSIELDDGWSGEARWGASLAPQASAARAVTPSQPPPPRVKSEPPAASSERAPVPSGDPRSSDVRPSDPARTSRAPSTPLSAPPPAWTEKLEAARTEARVRFESIRDDERWLVRAAPAATLVAFSIVLTFVDQMYAAVAGTRLSFGPVSPSWIAGLCFLGGVLWGAAWVTRRPG
jgi:serine/threonine-protein kinase